MNLKSILLLFFFFLIVLNYMLLKQCKGRVNMIYDKNKCNVFNRRYKFIRLWLKIRTFVAHNSII